MVFGFPDILFGPDDVFEKLLAKQREANADVVVGMYEARDAASVDMVKIDQDGRVQSIVLNLPTTELRHGWVCAVWSPVFAEFMHTFVRRARGRSDADKDAYRQIDSQGDLPFGAVMKSAFEAGLAHVGAGLSRRQLQRHWCTDQPLVRRSGCRRARSSSSPLTMSDGAMRNLRLLVEAFGYGLRSLRHDSASGA